MKNIGEQKKIGFIIIKYAFEVSPTIKELIRYLQQNNYHVDIITDKLYRDSNFSIDNSKVFTLGSSELNSHQECKDLLSTYDYVFAVEYLALSFLHSLDACFSNVVYLSLESTQYMLNQPMEKSSELLNKCMFGIIQSKERHDDFSTYFQNRLKLEFELLPVSIRPVNISCEKKSAKIIYSGYLSEWSGMTEFVNLFSKSRYSSFFELCIQGHSMGTDYYVHNLNNTIVRKENIKIDRAYYNDEEHLKLLSEYNIGIAVYKTKDASSNWDNLLFSSGKIATYLWTGCAVITNIDHELTKKPPFIFINDTDDITSLDKGFDHYINNTHKYYKESLALANKYYNLDSYAEKIVRRLNPAAEIKENEMNYSGGAPASKPIKLHLGCGENYFEGYINIDYPSDEHTVMKVRPDVACNLLELSLPDSSVDEIRLHHVFEHFNRVTALVLLIRWHKWLKPGGLLHIETPDLIGSAKTLLSDASYRVKTGVVRHLAGDQAASWAFHIDQWYPERFERTLSNLGFGNIKISTSSWKKEPYLSNVEVKASKIADIPDEEMLRRADELLWDSTVSDKEQPTYLVWKEQLRKAFRGEEIYRDDKKSASVKALGNDEVTVQLPPIDKSERSLLAYDFNQRERDNWVRHKAQSIPPGLTVLDVGAGTCPYQDLFRHCNYITHDFKKYEGVKLGHTHDYGRINIESDITSIPLEDRSVDVILCTEVLEHVPEPIKALEEMSRLLKPGGRILLTAPLGSGLHQLPYHYYGGYTPEWYRHFGDKYGLDIAELVPNGGFFKLLSQECSRFVSTLPQHAHLHGNYQHSLKFLFGDWLPKFLYQLESHCMIDQFTVGYHVEYIKKDKNNFIARSNHHTEEKRQSNKSTLLTGNSNASVEGIIFSKNRALQLEAVLRSFSLNCEDPENINLSVLYSSDKKYIHQYQALQQEYPGVNFIQEENFKSQLVNCTRNSNYILFLVDDNVFVRKFRLDKMLEAIDRVPAALGFSLRLGENTVYCYPKDAIQPLPFFNKIGDEYLSYNWVTAQYDFHYPLEVSSSIYRTREIFPILEKGDYRNPNTLEGLLDSVKTYYKDERHILLCPERSVTFCVPVNKVQTEFQNRSASGNDYDINTLCWYFDQGRRIDINKLQGVVPNACHQEMKLSFVQRDQYSVAKSSIPVTIYTAAYNAEKYISKTIESVLRQSFSNFEYLIVDDGSTDRTVEIIESYNDSRIRFFKREHKNFASAMNFAIQRATGDYIIGVDADDFIDHDYLEKIYSAAISNPSADYIYPEQFTIIDANGNITDEKAKFEDFGGERNKALVQKLFYEAVGRVPNPGSLKKRIMFDKLGLYEEIETIEDFVFMSSNALKINFRLAGGVTGYNYRKLESGNSNKFMVRGKIMADAIFNMSINYSPELFYPEINKYDPSEQPSRYLSFVYKIFRRHSQFYKGRGGEHFNVYAQKITEQLPKSLLDEETV